MNPDLQNDFLKREDFAALGSDAVAYMRKISAEDLSNVFPDALELKAGKKYWALFAANGQPLMLSDKASELKSSAFYNDLHAVLPN
ncbi:MAG: DUF1150 family protein [Pseudomonadota bacterium]